MASGNGLAKPNTKTGRLQRLLLDLFTEHARRDEVPTSLRFLFYELEQAGHAMKPPPGKRRNAGGLPTDADVSDAATTLRKLGLVPWEWVVDETRNVDEWQSDVSILDGILDRIEWLRLNPWHGSPPLILTESRSLAGVLRPLASRYVCPIASTNGQVGGFIHTDLVPLIGSGRDVMYIGDLDMQGHQIEANTRNVLERHAHITGWERLALTETQAQALNIDPVQKLDRRYNPPMPVAAVEAEALGQGEIVAIVTAAIEARLPEPLESVQVRERAEQARWRQHLLQQTP